MCEEVKIYSDNELEIILEFNYLIFQTIQFIVENSWRTFASRAIFKSIESNLFVDNQTSHNILGMYCNSYVKNHWSRSPIYDYFKNNNYLISKENKIFSDYYLYGALFEYLFTAEDPKKSVRIDTLIKDLIPEIDVRTFSRLFYLNKSMKNVLYLENFGHNEYDSFIITPFGFGYFTSSSELSINFTYYICQKLLPDLYRKEIIKESINLFESKASVIKDQNSNEYIKLSSYLRDLTEIQKYLK